MCEKVRMCSNISSTHSFIPQDRLIAYDSLELVAVLYVYPDAHIHHLPPLSLSERFQRAPLYMRAFERFLSRLFLLLLPYFVHSLSFGRAAAIFTFRAKLVLAASTPDEIQDIFSELSGMKVIPLLQSFLFAPRE